MAYEKQNFEDGQVLKAEHLNKIEDELARAKSWNDLTDKPFGEFPTGGDTLTLGLINPETIDPSTLVGEMFLKVSDTIMTMDDLSNGYTVKMDSATIEIPPEEVGGTITQFGDGLFLFGDAFISVEERAAGVDFEGLVFPESGMYIAFHILGGYVVSLTIPGYTGFPGIKTLDAKYMPNVADLSADWIAALKTALGIA